MPNFAPFPTINSKFDMNNASKRRPTVTVHVGNTTIGSEVPVRVQSMTTTPTLDAEATASQTVSIANAGAELVRITAQGVSHAANLAKISELVRQAGVEVPLVADIHFNPNAAYEAARHVEKVRINPGNFFDPGRTFRKMVFTDSEYESEVERLREKFIPFLEHCRANGTAIRIGVNHGSLSDRIMSRYGDGVEGMVESAMEFIRVCRDEHFNNVVISIKASEVPLMVTTVRRLVQQMDAENIHYPLHLGVTEAGNALEGRVKSAVGIGSLLADGIGDTIRVSLSEAPEAEIPVARELLNHIAAIHNGTNPMTYTTQGDVHTWTYPDDMPREQFIIAAAVDMGSMLLNGLRGTFVLKGGDVTEDMRNEIRQAIIQACGLERFKAEIVACPGCGRTLFELQEVLERVKERFHHLKHLKIAVMGCIVNGPGEMAGADYGYVGAAAGNVSLYRGTECVVRNIPQNEALDALSDLLKADGQWIDKPSDC